MPLIKDAEKSVGGTCQIARARHCAAVPESRLSALPDLPPPPLALLSGAALFLDFDGTLTPIADTPDAVVVDAGLIDMLLRLRDALGGRLAIVSGRAIMTLRALGFEDFLLAGTHGLEFAQPGGAIEAAARLPAIDAATQVFEAFCSDKPGMLVERKPLSVGLHFRGAPQWGKAAGELARAVAHSHGLAVQTGKMLFELRPGGADKGSAVRALMARAPMDGGVPLFIGDDVTDEEGFAAATQLGGAGILVGPQRSTHASWSLEQVGAVRHYLSEGATGLI